MYVFFLPVLGPNFTSTLLHQSPDDDRAQTRVISCIIFVYFHSIRSVSWFSFIYCLSVFCYPFIMRFICCLFDVVKRPHADHPCKSAQGPDVLPRLGFCQFSLDPLVMSTECHERGASPRAVMVSSALVPSLTEFPPDVRSHISACRCHFSPVPPGDPPVSAARPPSPPLTSFEDSLCPTCLFWIFLIRAQCFPFHNSFHNSDKPPLTPEPSSGILSNEV